MPKLRYSVLPIHRRTSDGEIWTGDLTDHLSFASRAERRDYLRPVPGDDKYARGGFVPVVFEAGTVQRRSASILGADPWVVLDFDGLPLEVLDRLDRLADLSGEVISSYSHGAAGKDGARLRVVLDLLGSQGVGDIAPARAGATLAVLERLGVRLGDLAPGVVDRSCWRPVQFFAVPVHRVGETPIFVELDGKPLDVVAALRAGRGLVTPSRNQSASVVTDYEPSEEDCMAALADEEFVCDRIASHVGGGFRSAFLRHGGRLANRIFMGQLDAEECLLAISDAIEASLENLTADQQYDPHANLQTRLSYFRKWFGEGRFDGFLVVPRLTFAK